MAVPMVLLSLVEQLGEADEELAGSYAELGDWCAGRILRHVQTSLYAPPPHNPLQTKTVVKCNKDVMAMLNCYKSFIILLPDVCTSLIMDH
ncbi:hypothetical protein J1605_010414 [Eschrichtius robustus]|uniref:Uncharacterized protein n=1 Tax=Eschrichtius robustus TaxID=9764 RepID=A0AB34GRF9_ESCRO|nr:hypothetical protein J1605_010414 [Eschrichtius robustus]